MSYMSHMMCYTCMSFVWMRIVRCVPQTARDVGDWCCLSWSENVINIMILSTKSLNSHHLKVANIQFSSTSLQPHRNRNFSGRIPSRDSRRWNWKFRKNIIEIRMTNYCYIQVIVFDFSYLLSKSATMKKLWKTSLVKNYNLNVTEVRHPDFTVGILFSGSISKSNFMQNITLSSESA